MYYKHFGLRDAPFQFAPSSTLFLSAAHLEGLAALQWGLREPSGLTLLAGEVGTGKTTLIHALLAHQNKTVRIALVSNPTLTFEEMLCGITQALGLYPVGKGKLAILQALTTFLADPATRDTVVLIFDEAQGLSDEILEEVRLLSNSKPARRDALQIVLVGQPELVQRLTASRLRALNQRIGARALLRPLRGAEINDYVNYLLHAQGARRSIFSRGALAQVAHSSGGIPRKINTLCHNSLLLAYADGSSVVKSRHVKAAAVGIEDLLPAPGNKDYQGVKEGRGAVHWMSGKGKLVIAAAFAVMAVALVLEFGSGRLGTWSVQAGSVIKDRASKVTEFSKVLFRNLRQNHQEPRNEEGIAASPPSRQSANSADGPVTQPPVAPAPEPPAPGARPGSTNVTRIAQPTRSLSETPNTLSSANSSSLAPAFAKRPHTRARQLRREIRRANASMRAGRYDNAIYHLQRAIALKPGSRVLRELLEQARAAESEPEESASTDDNSASSSAAGSEAPDTDTAPSTSDDGSDSGVVRR